jgi:hypothetical protein
LVFFFISWLRTIGLFWNGGRLESVVVSFGWDAHGRSRCVQAIGVRSHFLTNEFSNYRILTPPLRAFRAPNGDFFRLANYPFLTPCFRATSDD